MTVKAYLLSFPERLLRSALGLGAGLTRELGQIVLPDGIRRSQLYQNLVDSTLRFLIEQVGGAEGVYTAEGALPDNFLARRTAGNAVEALGIVAFRASPVWVLAALADLCGIGRRLIPEMADALKAQGLLEKDAQFTSVDQLLDGLERTSSRLATTINTPPLDVAGLRKEWKAIRDEARGLPSASLPSRETISNLWALLKTASARQERSVFETSSMMAVAAAQALPDGVRWLSASARVGAVRTGHIVAEALLDHYTQTLSEIQEVGYLAYARRQCRPYVRAAVNQFSPKRRTLTQRLLEKLAGKSNASRIVGLVGLTLLVASCDRNESPRRASPRATWAAGQASTTYSRARDAIGVNVMRVRRRGIAQVVPFGLSGDTEADASDSHRGIGDIGALAREPSRGGGPCSSATARRGASSGSLVGCWRARTSCAGR
jgi:hypothetical protein